MQLQSLFLSVLLSSGAIAMDMKNMPSMGDMKGMKMTNMTDECMCRDMAKLTKIVAEASNSTGMMPKMTASEMAKMEAEATKARAELAAMPVNSTLAAICTVVDSCDKMTEMAKIMAIVNDPKALQNATNGDATKIATLKMEASMGMAEIATMEKNATLMAQCATLKQAATVNGQKATTTTNSATSLLNAKFGVLATGLLVVVGMVAL